MDINTPSEISPSALVAGLVDLLDIEEIDTDLYRGKRQPGYAGRVFGGQVIAQALQAAQRSTEAPKVAHSLHAYFMRPGDDSRSIIFRVIRDFEGRSFATRRVVAMQKGQPILNLAASFQTPEEGLHHEDAMPDVPAPETLRNERQICEDMADELSEKLRTIISRGRPIEIKPVHPSGWLRPETRPPRQQSWFRLCAPIGDDAALHRAVLAYASDLALLGTSGLPHGVSLIDRDLQTASLDHAVWLHEPFRADDWLLYDCDSPWAGGARGFNRGRVFSRDGRLVASTAQEGLIRLRR